MEFIKIELEYLNLESLTISSSEKSADAGSHILHPFISRTVETSLLKRPYFSFNFNLQETCPCKFSCVYTLSKYADKMLMKSSKERTVIGRI